MSERHGANTFSKPGRVNPVQAEKRMTEGPTRESNGEAPKPTTSKGLPSEEGFSGTNNRPSESESSLADSRFTMPDDQLKAHAPDLPEMERQFLNDKYEETIGANVESSDSEMSAEVTLDTYVYSPQEQRTHSNEESGRSDEELSPVPWTILGNMRAPPASPPNTQPDSLNNTSVNRK